MRCNIRKQTDYAIVELGGDVDLSTSPEARQAILKCLQENLHVLVDLGSVDYIDSSGVASLVEGFQVAKNSSLQFTLASVSERAMSVLKLARLDRVFQIVATEQDWFEQFNGKTC